ncbi:MAG TPA: tyrosine-type recombinase/integrase [Micromonosporaceae bacterium]
MTCRDVPPGGRRRLKVIKGGKPFLGPLKTKTSRRTVELPDVVGLALAKHLEGGVRPVLVGDDTDPRKPVRREAALLFRSTTGEPVNAATFCRLWAPARQTVGLPPRWGFHGLRHCYATLLIHAGASVKTVQLALGHSTPMVTLNAYSHEWPDVIDRTRSLVDGALGVREAAARSMVSRS